MHELFAYFWAFFRFADSQVARGKTGFVDVPLRVRERKDGAAFSFASGSVRSCGCLLKTMPKMVHGKTLASTTLEYKTWDAMIRRCHQPSHFAFHNYGARGITVCERWRGDAGFGNFLADMGHKHRGESLDRINNDDGYSPENCRWTGRHIQANNRRGNIRFESLGKSLTLAEWSRLTGTSDNTMRERLKRGWTVDDSIHGRIKLP